MTKKKNDIIKLVGNLKSTPKVVIFCGAGISRDSGLPLAKELIIAVNRYLFSTTEFHRKLYMDYQEQIDGYYSNIMMEVFFQELKNQLGDSIYDIFNVFKNGEPNFNHLFIAQLVKHGYIDVIFTTNFDTLLEQAFEKVGIKKDNFIVASDDEDFKIYGGKIVIYKLHGTVQNINSLITTLDGVGTGLSKNKEEILSHYLSSNPFWFIGWSNNDYDITSVIKNYIKSFYSHIPHIVL